MQGPAPGSGSLVMLLLDRGIPLSLLLDLADPRGPQSEDLLHHETSGPRRRRPGA